MGQGEDICKTPKKRSLKEVVVKNYSMEGRYSLFSIVKLSFIEKTLNIIYFNFLIL